MLNDFDTAYLTFSPKGDAVIAVASKYVWGIILYWLLWPDAAPH